MTTRRILASSIVVLMLSVSSMAAACDLSCSFAQRRSDCHTHAKDANHFSSSSAGMGMDGMAMDGMAMPEMATDEDPTTVSANAGGMPSHPSIGEMGPCERQSCDNGSAISARTPRTATPQVHLVWAPVEALLPAHAPTVFHDARDSVATPIPQDRSHLFLSLRI